MNAPHRSEAIRLAQERISELEKEISCLRQAEQSDRELEFTGKLFKLMKKFKLEPGEVIDLLVTRGDLDRRLFGCETTYKLKHILGLRQLEAERRGRRP